MVDYNAVVNDLGRGIKDLSLTVYDVTGTALTGTGNSLYHLSLRKVDLRDIFSSNVTRWIAIAGMVWLAYSHSPIQCGSKQETQAQTAQIQTLEKKVADLKTELNFQRSCTILPQDNPAYYFSKGTKQ